MSLNCYYWSSTIVYQYIILLIVKYVVHDLSRCNLDHLLSGFVFIPSNDKFPLKKAALIAQWYSDFDSKAFEFKKYQIYLVAVVAAHCSAAISRRIIEVAATPRRGSACQSHLNNDACGGDVLLFIYLFHRDSPAKRTMARCWYFFLHYNVF